MKEVPDHYKLAYPIICESHDLDGTWILVNLTEYRGNNKWQAFDEDGETVVVDASTLRNPYI